MDHSTPYFIFKPEILEKNFKNLDALCKKYLKKYIIAYSVKTNSFHALLEKLNKLGSSFEVASLNEIIYVENFGKKIIFNGPCKTKEELQKTIKNNMVINVDSRSEMEKIISLLKGKPYQVGIRINLNESKFGFDESQLQDIIACAKDNLLKIRGLHFHPGTQQSLSDYEIFLSKVYEFLKRFFEMHAIHLDYIDLGGGFPDHHKLKNLGHTLEDYFQSIAQTIGRLKNNYDTIAIEPGRCLVADAFELITRINVIKERGDITYAILDAGINLLPKIALSQFTFSKIKQTKETKEKSKEYVLAGPLLFNNDLLGKFHGNLKEGDRIKIENVGAYCYNLAWEISYKKPQITIGKK
ncbi:MAG: Diaminopimelate decarboxylase [archaeon]|jgi:diaminopimelate decarboxylase